MTSRKLSAQNKFKKYVLGPITEQATVNADYIAIKPVERIRLLSKAYAIMWEELILKPLYECNNCETEEQKANLKSQKNIQEIYNKQVRGIRKYKKKGELDDQEHFRDDLTIILTDAIKRAAMELGIKK